MLAHFLRPTRHAPQQYKPGVVSVWNFLRILCRLLSGAKVAMFKISTKRQPNRSPSLTKDAVGCIQQLARNFLMTICQQFDNNFQEFANNMQIICQQFIINFS